MLTLVSRSAGVMTGYVMLWMDGDEVRW